LESEDWRYLLIREGMIKVWRWNIEYRTRIYDLRNGEARQGYWVIG